MSTRANDQQKKQRQKEFKERKEHQQSLKIAAKKGKPNSARKDAEGDELPKNED